MTRLVNDQYEGSGCVRPHITPQLSTAESASRERSSFCLYTTFHVKEQELFSIHQQQRLKKLRALSELVMSWSEDSNMRWDDNGHMMKGVWRHTWNKRTARPLLNTSWSMNLTTAEHFLFSPHSVSQDFILWALVLCFSESHCAQLYVLWSISQNTQGLGSGGS